MSTSLVERDLKHLWHPCSQMKDYEAFPPLCITHAAGDYLYLDDNTRVIDAISSWWCKSLGHCHPRLQAALTKQASTLGHAILANTTNETIVELSERLTAASPMHNKVFYASDGSCAVEIALKLAIHAQALLGAPQRTKFIALKNGYHGETALTLSVSDLGLYKAPYEALLQTVPMIDPAAYCLGPSDPSWNQPITEIVWAGIEAQLAPLADTAAALILEPILQGAGGMKIYHPDVLKRLRAYTKANGIFLIADEIMTGVGRTGKFLACEHAGIEADLVCLSKSLTSGMLPLSAVLIPDSLYDLFYDDYETGKAFLHSHTHTGNTLAAAVANETLNIMEEEQLYDKAAQQGTMLHTKLQAIADKTGLLGPVRQVGSLVAAELIGDADTPRNGYRIFQRAIKLGALLRPLGNTLYWMPPMNAQAETLDSLAQITEMALNA